MEPLTTIAALASVTAIVAAAIRSFIPLTVLRRHQDARVLLKFKVNGREVDVEYDSGKLKSESLSPEELNHIVERLKSASE